MMEKINWFFINHIAHSAIAELNITRFPVPIFSLLSEQEDVVLCPYSKLKDEENMTDTEIVHKLTKSIEGSTIYRSNKFFIFFNDDTGRKSPQRIRYTLAHELGHILLGHFTGDDAVLSRNSLSNGLPKKVYNQLEKEANAFASEFLSPIELVAPTWSFKEVANIFDISRESAKIVTSRLKDNVWLYGNNSFPSISSFSYITHVDYLNHVPLIPKGFYASYIHHGYCKKCRALIPMYSFKTFNFCPICGRKFTRIINQDHNFMFHELEEKNVIEYKSIELGENSKALICPICKSKPANEDAPFCEICGHYLINRCSGYTYEDLQGDDYNEEYQPHGTDFLTDERMNACTDGQKLGGRDRYCPFCGCLSTFELQKFLPDYKNEMVEFEKKNTVKSFPTAANANPYNQSDNIKEQFDSLPF
ncbi:ImmA/IrrE family metallo-endopeptidase [Levilactobacillus brevis]|uniref:ImmA/IrrE family metallo-endopeptidase n=1 Tax=Levilactobacillus brevis TaxID=1580 RepID=UPI003F4AB14E